jgi:outer membrane autotransporter protein
MYRGLLLASVSLFAVSAAHGAQLYWTGAGANNLWSNNNNWGAPAAPGAADGAHLELTLGSLGNNELVELSTGQQSVASLFVEGNFYELTDDGQNVMLAHNLNVTNTLAVNENLTLAVSGSAQITAQGAIDLSGTQNGLLLSDYGRLTLDGADLDSGRIRLEDQASLEVFQTGATAGGIVAGTQDFYDSSALLANETESVSGGEQNFHDLSYLYANADRAVTGGVQSFSDAAQLRAVAANSVAGGRQVFSDFSQLRPEVAGSIGDTTIELRDDASIASQVVNGLTDETDVVFSSVGLGAGGTFLLSGLDQVVGTILSTDGSNTGTAAGLITNNALQDATLTVRSANDSNFGGVLSDGVGGGSLGLNKEGNGRLFLNGTSTYSGQTDVIEGELAVYGDISSSSLLIVEIDGTLSGTGTVGATSIAGGTVRPGYWDSTLNVDGPMAMMDGTLAVDIRGAGDGSAGGSSLVAVNGDLNLQGNINVEVWNYGYTYSAGSAYTIATSDLITGAGDLALVGGEISPFLQFVLSKDATSIILTVERDATLASAAETPNQEAVGEAVDGLPDGSPVFDMVASLDEAGALAALDALSGELHASLKGGLIEDSRFVREASLGRLEDRDGEGAGLWTEAYGARAVWGSDGNAAETTRDAHGLFAGADGTVGDFRFGALLGYGQSGYGVVDRGSSASVDSYQAALYGGTVNGPFLLRGGLAYARHDITTRRDVVIEDVDFAASYDASYGGATTQAFGEVGYRLEMDAVSVTPFAGLAYINASTDGFTEAGGVGALTAEAESVDQTYAALGLRAEAAFDLGDMSARLHGSLAWRHAFGELAQTATLSIGGSDPYSVAGVPTARDAALVEAGVDVDLSDSATVSALYSGVITESATDQSLKGVLSVKF